MQDFGGPESFSPSEGASSGNEQLSETAAAQFAATAAALQQIRKEEKQSRKRDDNVAQAILKFLTDEQRVHLSVLISRLVALDCPTSFIIAILSLINTDCLASTQEYLREHLSDAADDATASNASIVATNQLDAEQNRALVEWITRMQMVLSLNAEAVLKSLKTDDANLDGTILQLTTFVLQEFFQAANRDVSFEKIHPLAASILQSVFEPYF